MTLAQGSLRQFREGEIDLYSIDDIKVRVSVKGKIVLIPFPFTGLTSAKLRLDIVSFEGERDVVYVLVVICG